MLPLEALFERFRAHGDVAALAQVFDRTAPSLVALAHHLVRDRAEADDLVQSTFVAAIEGAATFEAGRPLEPWLAGILARQAARVWRARSRADRTGREEFATLTEPAGALEERELVDALQLALARLEPRDRDVLRRYLGGERPHEIAARERRSAGAVRMQVMRGLERLRRWLPRGLHAWFPLAPRAGRLDVVRSEVLRRAERFAALAHNVPAGAGLTTIAMSTKWLVTFALVCAVTLISLRRRSEAPGGAPPPTREVAHVASEVKAVGLSPLVSPADTTGRRDAHETRLPEVAWAPEAAATGLWLFGELRGLAGLDPTAVVVCVRAHDLDVSTRGRSDGTYTLDASPLGPTSLDRAFLSVLATHPDWRRACAEVRVDDGLRARLARGVVWVRVDLDLSPRTSVIGRVSHGRPSAALVRDGVVEATSEPDNGSGNEFTLEPREPGAFELWVRVPGRLPVRRPVQVAKEQILDVGLLALEDVGVTIAGRLASPELYREGMTLTATRLGAAEAPSEPVWSGAGLLTGDVRDATTRIEADGTFCFTALQPGEYALSLEDRLRREGVQLAFDDCVVRAPTTDVVFGAELGLVRLVPRGGAVAPPATLYFHDGASPGGELHGARGVTLVDGRSVDVLADRRRMFSASLRTAHATSPWVAFSAGRPALVEGALELVADPDRQYGELALTWRAPEGVVLTRTVRAYFERDGETGNVEADAGPEGCRFERLQSGRYRCIVVPRSAQFWEPLPSFAMTEPIEVAIEPGRTTSIEVEWRLGGRVRFVPTGEPDGELESVDAVVHDASGARCVTTFVRVAEGADGTRESYASLSLLAPSEIEPNLSPGAYTLALIIEGREALRMPFHVAAGQLVDVPFELPE